jgi:hypothetical protein
MFSYRLELANGDPAEPPRFVSATPEWRPGDPMFVSPRLRCRVIGIRRRSAREGADVLIVMPE